MSKITALEQLRACAVASKNFVRGLIGEVAGTVADALEELDGAKMDKTAAVPVTIPTTGWGSDSTTGYPKYFDIAVNGLTANDRAEVTLAYESLAAAKACAMCPTNETMAGKIRIRAAAVPETAIVAEYWITNGKE